MRHRGAIAAAKKTVPVLCRIILLQMLSQSVVFVGRSWANREDSRLWIEARGLYFRRPSTRLGSRADVEIWRNWRGIRSQVDGSSHSPGISSNVLRLHLFPVLLESSDDRDPGLAKPTGYAQFWNEGPGDHTTLRPAQCNLAR